MTFRVGQRVVCVDASRGRPLRGARATLVKNAIYTIRKIEIWNDVTGVYLEEIIEPVLDVWLDRGPTEPCWRLSRFRPVVERKTDISIFKRLLVPGTKIHETA
jgi:hypothetical protein